VWPLLEISCNQSISKNTLTLTLTLTLILLLQPETTATFGSIHRLCHSNYDLSTPTRIRSFELARKSPVIFLKIVAPWQTVPALGDAIIVGKAKVGTFVVVTVLRLLLECGAVQTAAIAEPARFFCCDCTMGMFF
jgi:hypothetical protein